MSSAEDLGIVGDGETDCVPAFLAAMADPAVSTIEFGPGHYRFDSQVALRSGIAIRGCGRATRLSPLPTFAPRTHLENAMISTVPGSAGIKVSDLLLEGMSIGAGASATRIHALVMRRTSGFRVRRVLGRDWSGYAFWASGDDPVSATDRACSGEYEDCWAENSNVLFEQSLCRGVKLRRCHGGDGVKTIHIEAAFHPWHGAEQVTYEDCTYSGGAGAGMAVLSVGAKPLKEIIFRRVRIHMEAGTTAVVVANQSLADAPYRIDLTVEDSEIASPLGNCANLWNVDGVFRRNKMSGYNLCTALQGGANVLFEDCDQLASNDPAGTPIAHALRLEANNTAVVTRGALRARGKNPVPFIKSPAATLTVSPQTVREPP
jgi:hypothetical protein